MQFTRNTESPLKNKSLLLLITSFMTPALALSQTTLTPNLPVNGKTYTWPLTVSAKNPFAHPSGWTVYFDSQLVDRNYDTTGLYDNSSWQLTLSPGNHSIVIKAYDSSGAVAVASENVTISSSSLPFVPLSAQVFSNLQLKPAATAQQQWMPCNSSNGCAGPQTSGTPFQAFGVASPSLSGTSMQQGSTGANFNTMYYLHLGCLTNGGCDAVQNMLEDMWFQPASNQTVQQFEFDPDLFDTQKHKYFATVACRLVGTNAMYWFLWNSVGNGDGTIANQGLNNGSGAWDQTPFPCTLTTVAAGAWHHLQLHVTFDTNSKRYAYQTFVYDGVSVFSNYNQSFGAYTLTPQETANGYNAAINIEQQIDNTSAATSQNSVFYDNYTLSVW